MPNIGKQRYQGLNKDFAVITGVTAVAAEVLDTKIFVNSSGALTAGAMVNKAAAAIAATPTLDADASKVVMTVPSNGYYSTTSTLTATYAAMATLIGLTAEKIVTGNTILGIEGTG